MIEDRTVLVFRAFTRSGVNADDTLEEVVEKLSANPLDIKKRVIYVPITYADLIGSESGGKFVIDYNDEKCHVIREWEVIFEGIIDNFPIHEGCVSYDVRTRFIFEGIPL